jgi:hypothetical protein
MHEGLGISQISSITDRDENIPLESHGSDRRTQEKVRDPNPWSNDGALPVVFEVTGRDALSICVQTVKQNAYSKSWFIPKGAMRVEKTRMMTRIAS